MAEVINLKQHGREGVNEARQYVSAMLGLQVWAHKLYGAMHAARTSPATATADTLPRRRSSFAPRLEVAFGPTRLWAVVVR